MHIEFKDVSEQDMDMLIIEEFICNESFRYLFYDQEGIKLNHNFFVSEAYRSLSDSDGESDITFILCDGKTRVAILIEDKIDAPTMEQQSERYITRAEKGKADGKYDEYYIFLVCPEDYWQEHREDKNAQYKYQVFYENIRDLYVCGNNYREIYKYQVIKTAIEAKKKGYQVIENETVTKFWKELRRFCNVNYKHLIMLGEETAKGADACWPEFQTALKQSKIVYKSNKGYVDLQIAGYGDKIGDLSTILGGKIGNDMRIDHAKKSAAIRIHNPQWEISFKQPFSDVEETIKDVLSAVERLTRLAEQLNYSDLY